jgi:futalosine hydrolase
MIQAGIAGSFSQQLPILSTVLVEDDGMGDLGAEEQGSFKDIFDLHLADQNNFPFTDRRLKNPAIAEWQNTGFKAVPAITVNEISTREARIEELKIKYQADLESMEGAAFHYVCLQEKISFVQVRCISNFVGERDKKNWKLKESIDVLNESLIHLIQESL